jgi:hypothetical protein
MSREKNPYEMDTPEWQLFERVTSEELKALSYAQEAEKATTRCGKAKEQAELYRTALAKLVKE